MRELPNLDFLRACAVLSVVIEHLLLAYNVQRIGYWQVRWMGVAGVFLFFVHTCLVLMWSLERKPHTLDFYIRRIFRIYPLAVVTMVVVFFFHVPAAGTPENFFQYHAPDSRMSALSALMLVPNLYRHNYLPYGVLWSLPYEVEMYFILPLLFFFIQRNFSLWPLLALWTFVFTLCHSLFPQATHNFPISMIYFLPGAIAYVGFGRRRAVLPSWLFPVFLVLMWSIFMARPSYRATAGLFCLGTGLALPFFHQLRNKGLIAMSHQIAKYSYGAYLAHPICLVLSIYLMPNRPLALQLAVFVSSLLVLSVGAYHFLERPMIRIGSRLAAGAERRYEQRQLSEFRIPEAEIS